MHRCSIDFNNTEDFSMFQPFFQHNVADLIWVRPITGQVCDRRRDCPSYELLDVGILDPHYERDGEDERRPFCSQIIPSSPFLPHHKRRKRSMAYVNYHCLNEVGFLHNNTRVMLRKNLYRILTICNCINTAW